MKKKKTHSYLQLKTLERINLLIFKYSGLFTSRGHTIDIAIQLLEETLKNDSKALFSLLAKDDELADVKYDYLNK